MDMETVEHLRHQSRSVRDVAPDERRPNECRQGRTGGRAGDVSLALTPTMLKTIHVGHTQHFIFRDTE